MNWFYAKNGSQQGPLSTEDIKSRIAMGEIGPSDLAWCEGMSDWLPVGQIPQLKIEAPVREDSPPPVFGAPAPSPYQSPASPTASPSPAQPVLVQTPSQGLAIGSMICGILAFLGCCIWFLSGPLALVAIVLGHIAIAKIKRSPAYGGKGMARTGLIFGYLGLLGAILIVALGVYLSTMSPAQREDFIKALPPEMQQQMRESFEQAEKARQPQQ